MRLGCPPPQTAVPPWVANSAPLASPARERMSSAFDPPDVAIPRRPKLLQLQRRGEAQAHAPRTDCGASPLQKARRNRMPSVLVATNAAVERLLAAVGCVVTDGGGVGGRLLTGRRSASFVRSRTTLPPPKKKPGLGPNTKVKDAVSCQTVPFRDESQCTSETTAWYLKRRRRAHLRSCPSERRVERQSSSGTAGASSQPASGALVHSLLRFEVLSSSGAGGHAQGSEHSERAFALFASKFNEMTGFLPSHRPPHTSAPYPRFPTVVCLPAAGSSSSRRGADRHGALGPRVRRRQRSQQQVYLGVVETILRRPISWSINCLALDGRLWVALTDGFSRFT